MAQFHKITRNMVFSTLSEMTNLLTFLLLILAAQFLGAEKYGIFSFAYAFVALFEITKDWGLRYVLMIDASRTGNADAIRRYFNNALTLQLCLSLVGSFAVFVIANLIAASNEIKYTIYLLEGATILRCLKFLFRYLFRVLDRFDLEALSSFLERLILIIAGGACLIWGYSVVVLASVFVVVRLVDFLVVLTILRTYFWLPSFHFDFSRWRQTLKSTLPFALTGVMMMALLRMDTIILHFLTSNVEVGWYNAALRLIEGAYIIPVIITSSIFPVISASAQGSNWSPAATAVLTRGLKYGIMAAIPLVIIGNVLASHIVLALFHEEYKNTVLVFQISLVSLFFSFIYLIAGAGLGALGRQKAVAVVAAMTLALNITANVVLIWRYGYIGAGLASVISSTFFAIANCLYLVHSGCKIPFLELIMKPLIASMVLCLVVILFKSFSIGLTLLTVISLYPVLLRLLRYWDEEELLLFRRSMRLATAAVVRSGVVTL